MTSLIKVILLTVILGISSTCQSQSTVSYANELNGCLGSSEIELLNSLSQKFEKILTSTYNLSTNECYKKYLIDIATMNIPQNFFVYPTFEKDMKKFKGSEFYQSSWNKTSSFDKDFLIEAPRTIVDGEIQKQETYDPIVLDPTSNYVTCLIEKNKSNGTKEYLDVVKAGIDINPRLVAQALSENLSRKEFNFGLTRLIIAINFHYQIGLLIAEE